MRTVILPLLIFGSSLAVYADFAVQTDWSGGPGIYGPVLNLGTEFHFDTNVDWISAPGSMMVTRVNEHIVSDNFPLAHFVYSEDIDGDGDMDVLGASYIGYVDVTWWENQDGLGTSMIQHTVDDHFFGAYSVRAEDIDGDGWMDVTGAANTHDEITWWRNNDGSGTSWIERIVDPNCDGAASVYTQDINGDGYMDILSAAMVDDDITWWENVDGSGVQWTEHIIDGDFDGARYVYSEDIDSDGDMDVLGAAYYAGEITWWENSDTSPGIIWTEHNIATGFTGASCVIAGDINDDGFMDILATPRWATGITWWENDGNAVISWTEHLVCSDFGYISAYPADVDDDGDMDVLAAGIEYDVIEWWENLGGAGTSWTGHTVENNFSIANCVYAEDINGDGVMDVLGSSYSDDEITWWNLEEYSSEASFESSFFDTQGSPDWDYLDWNADTPPGTSVSFCVRTSEHPNHPEAWSDTLDFPCSLEGVVQDEHRYIQYAAIFTTSNPDTTPTLSDVSISWNPLGIERTAELIPSGTELLPFIPNPASTPAVRFGLHEPASVDISVFDMSGRLVFDNHGHEYSQGYHNIALVSLSSGIYFCRLAAGDYSATQRFVVIE